VGWYKPNFIRRLTALGRLLPFATDNSRPLAAFHAQALIAKHTPILMHFFPSAFSTRARVNTPAKPKKSPIRHQPHHNKSAIFPAVLLGV